MSRKQHYRSHLALVVVFGACLLMPCTGAAWGQWEQIHKLSADDAAEEDWFGCSVSISGTTLIIGAIWDDDAGADSGSVYLFDAITGQQLGKLMAADGAEGDYFGDSVFVAGDTIVVGAPYDDDAGDSSGSAYVFNATTGQQLHKLTADDAAEYDWFGGSVSVDGNTIVIGASGDDDTGSHSGSAYVFDVITWEQLHKLTADDAAAGDYFGGHVSIAGNTIIVGASNDDESRGAAYVFDATTGQQLHKLTADDAAELDSFGGSVSVKGDKIVVGAPWDDDLAGSVYVFDAATGQQLLKVIADDPASFACFGNSVSIGDNIIVVGCFSDSHAGWRSGSAYVFDAATGLQLQKLTADDAAAVAWFGNSVSVSGKTIAIGAPRDGEAAYDAGAAYLFQELAPCPADLNGDEVVDIDDLFAVLAAWGTCDACPEDINDDGVVDIDDLFAVLASWGPCP